MIKLKERYIVDENGNRIEVILTLEDYQRLLAELEELEAIHAYDIAKSSGDEAIPFALKSIQETRGFLRGIDTTVEREEDRI